MIDTRAYAWCNLGPLASEVSSIAEDHAQGAGVVTLRGTINLAGIYRPAPGTVVSLAYSDGQNWLARLPLRLVVLSSFANPLGGNVTSVSVGCDLAYLEDRKLPPVSYTEKQINSSTTDEERRDAVPPMPASALAQKIISDLGLQLSGAIPLTNKIRADEFDLSTGYVAELGKLAVSEGYMARMTPGGLVEFVPKSLGVDTSVLITEEDLIDFNPINGGETGAEAVYAKYLQSSVKKPDTSDSERKKRNWEREVSVSGTQVHAHNWTQYVTQQVGTQEKVRAEIRYGAYTGTDGKRYFGEYVQNNVLYEPVYDVVAIEREERVLYTDYSETLTSYDDKDRVVRRRTYARGLYTPIGAGGSTPPLVLVSETTYEYNAASGTLGPRELIEKLNQQVSRETTIEYGPAASVKQSVGIQSSFSSLRGYITTAKRVVEYDRNEETGITQTRTTNYVLYSSTPDGSAAISERVSRLKEYNQGADRLAIYATATQLVEYGSEVRIRTEREFGTQRRPPAASRTRWANSTKPETEEQEAMVFVFGSAQAKTSIELSPPYYTKPYVYYDNGWQVNNGDAPQKARQYAVTENRLLIGHRNGAGIQVLPELLPPQPLGLVFIRLNNATAAFRCNGTTWNLSPEGCTATTDALFWGAIDGAVANAWFPLPPNASTLPAAAAVTVNASPKPANAIAIPAGFNPASPDLAALFAALPTDAAPVFPKTITPGVLVKPYHETLEVTGGVGIGAVVTTQPWIIQPPVGLIGGIGLGAAATFMRLIQVSGGIGCGAIANGMKLTPVVGSIGTGATVVDAGAVYRVDVGIALGAALEKQVHVNGGIGIGGTASIKVGPDPFLSQVQILLHCDGNFTDSSSAARTVTNVGSVQFDATYSVANSSGYVPSGARKLSVNGGIDIPASTPATLEIWFRATNVTDFGLFGDNLTGNGQLLAVLNGQLTCFWNTLGTPELKGGTVNANQAHRAAVTRDSSGIVRLFLDGTLVSTAGAANNQAFRLVDILGAPYRGNFLGWFDEVRVTVGATGCRYVTSYTPPATPFSDV